jgi:hypothetical protein
MKDINTIKNANNSNARDNRIPSSYLYDEDEQFRLLKVTFKHSLLLIIAKKRNCDNFILSLNTLMALWELKSSSVTLIKTLLNCTQIFQDSDLVKQIRDFPEPNKTTVNSFFKKIQLTNIVLPNNITMRELKLALQEAFIINVVFKMPEAFLLIESNLKNNHQIIKHLIDENGLVLEYLPSNMQDNLAIVHQALSKNIGAIRFVSERIKSSKVLMLKLIGANPSLFLVLPENLACNQEFILQLIKRNASLISCMPEKDTQIEKLSFQGISFSSLLQEDPKFIKKVLKINFKVGSQCQQYHNLNTDQEAKDLQEIHSILDKAILTSKPKDKLPPEECYKISNKGFLEALEKIFFDKNTRLNDVVEYIVEQNNFLPNRKRFREGPKLARDSNDRGIITLIEAIDRNRPFDKNLEEFIATCVKYCNTSLLDNNQNKKTRLEEIINHLKEDVKYYDDNRDVSIKEESPRDFHSQDDSYKKQFNKYVTKNLELQSLLQPDSSKLEFYSYLNVKKQEIETKKEINSDGYTRF